MVFYGGDLFRLDFSLFFSSCWSGGCVCACYRVADCFCSLVSSFCLIFFILFCCCFLLGSCCWMVVFLGPVHLCMFLLDARFRAIRLLPDVA
jgi:hypothetical protein